MGKFPPLVGGTSRGAGPMGATLRYEEGGSELARFWRELCQQDCLCSLSCFRSWWQNCPRPHQGYLRDGSWLRRNC